MRSDPPQSGPELQALTGFLDWERETILLKTDGLTRDQLARPSGSDGGLRRVRAESR